MAQNVARSLLFRFEFDVPSEKLKGSFRPPFREILKFLFSRLLNSTRAHNGGRGQPRDLEIRTQRGRNRAGEDYSMAKRPPVALAI